jgi:hypothetical protein
MSYEERFDIVKNSLIDFVKERIASRYNYNNEFHIWSYSAIKEAYVSKFKEEFSEYVNSGIESKLWFAGQNIGFAVQTFIDLNPNYTLDNLLEYVETFLTIQLDNFGDWCDEIGMAMLTDETQQMNEDNAS